MDPHDAYLTKSLKNWAAMYRSPVNGKIRLLRAVEYMRDNHTGNSQILPGNSAPFFIRLFKIYSNDDQRWDDPPSSINWALVYPYEIRMMNMRLVL
jgi:hypothetical protein